MQRDQQKRPTKETYRRLGRAERDRWCIDGRIRDAHMSKKTYTRAKRHTKETNQRDLRTR